MVDLICIPRINALGLKGPESSCEDLLDSDIYETVDIKNEDIHEDEQTIFDYSKDALLKKCLFIGGDHSITYPIGKAFLEKEGRADSFLIVFDAHADCMESMKEPTHEEIIRGLVEVGWRSENIIMIGVRKIETQEMKFLKENDIMYFSAEENEKGILKEIELRANEKSVYLSIDIDVFDPSIAPGVNCPEKDGIDEEYFLRLLRGIYKKTNIKAYDLVEIVRKKDVESKTVELGQRIIKNIVDLEKDSIEIN
jgi:agmatinase